MFKEKKNKTTTKADVSSSLLFLAADYQIFCGLPILKYMVMKYMVFGFLKVAVIGKVLLQSSGLMKTVAVTKKSVEKIWTHPHGRGLGLTSLCYQNSLSSICFEWWICI